MKIILPLKKITLVTEDIGELNLCLLRGSLHSLTSIS